MKQTDLIAWFKHLEASQPKENVSNHAGLAAEAGAWLYECRAACAAALPLGHVLLREWDVPLSPTKERSSRSPDAYALFQRGVSLTTATRRLVESDRVGSLSASVRIQTESEVLETAFVLLNEGDPKLLIAAVVLAGGALEVHMRRLFELVPDIAPFKGSPSIEKYANAIDTARNEGKPVPYDATTGKQVKAWGAARNDAAHTPDRFKMSPAEVRLMLDGVQNFLASVR